MRVKFHLLRRKNLNPTRIVAGSFGAVILAGTLLLSLPAASRSGVAPDLLTRLFTATSATCVTGLVTVDTATQWSFLGQVVILGMIQLGGLGFITVMTLFSLMLRRKIGLSERLLLTSNFNVDDLNNVVRLVRFTLKWTLIFEGCGAALLALRFIPRFGFAKGVWYGVFHAVSAFCNAGFDLMGEGAPFQSLAGFHDDPVVLTVIMALIVIGGLGFFVWKDIADKRRFRDLTVYSKLVLELSAGLIAVGAAVILAVEFHNPGTLGPMPLWEKVLNALFQSVTFRTAGFGVLDQSALRDSSMVLGCIWMLIGGSSGSTAGGLKTVTLGVLLLNLWADFRGRSQVTVRGWAIRPRQLRSATTLTLTVVLLLLTGSMFLSLWDGIPYLQAGFETASALGTVGLSAGVTTQLSAVSRVLVMGLMYLGRVGILSFSIAFAVGRASGVESKIKYPFIDVMIG